LQYSVSHGLAYVIVVSLFAHRSGAHVNPAITLVHVLARRLGLLVGLMYFAAQSEFVCVCFCVCVCPDTAAVLGALVGAGFVDAMTGDRNAGSLGVQDPSSTFTNGENFGWEFFAVFVVVLVYMRNVNWRATPAGQFASDHGVFVYGAAITAVSLMAVRTLRFELGRGKKFFGGGAKQRAPISWLHVVG
jgi:glycerol uptake facilitator-like aquaporin